MTKHVVYPIPRMDQSIESLGEGIVFAVLDSNSGYRKVEIESEDRDKTSYNPHNGIYCFLLTLHVLWNDANAFQRTKNVALSAVNVECAMVYLEDILVFF